MPLIFESCGHSQTSVQTDGGGVRAELPRERAELHGMQSDVRASRSELRGVRKEVAQGAERSDAECGATRTVCGAT